MITYEKIKDFNNNKIITDKYYVKKIDIIVDTIINNQININEHFIQDLSNDYGFCFTLLKNILFILFTTYKYNITIDDDNTIILDIVHDIVYKILMIDVPNKMNIEWSNGSLIIKYIDNIIETIQTKNIMIDIKKILYIFYLFSNKFFNFININWS